MDEDCSLAMGRHDATLFKKEHQRAGERLRWLKAIPVPAGTPNMRSDGVILVEQTIPAAARFLVSSTTEDEDNTPFGLITKGTMQISAFPDWARFNHLDRIILTAPGRLLSKVAKVTRAASGATDVFGVPHIVSITNVWVAGETVDKANYRTVESGIEWLAPAPDAGTVYSVEYLHAPRYLVLPQSHRTSPTDRNGISLPLRYWLQREQNT